MIALAGQVVPELGRHLAPPPVYQLELDPASVQHSACALPGTAAVLLHYQDHQAALLLLLHLLRFDC